MDESNVLDSSFLERMNTLLANGEVPGLFEGDEFTTLMTQCKEGAVQEGLMLDSQEELYKWFTQQVTLAAASDAIVICIPVVIRIKYCKAIVMQLSWLL